MCSLTSVRAFYSRILYDMSFPGNVQHEHFVQMGHDVWSDSSFALKTSSVTDEYMDSDVHPSPFFFPPQVSDRHMLPLYLSSHAIDLSSCQFLTIG